MSASTTSDGTSRFLIGFAAFWCSLLLLVEVGLAADALRQLRALTWLEAPGRVLGSEVEEDTSGDAPSYSVAVRYRYEVAGRSHEGTVVRHGGLAHGSRRSAERERAALAPGAAVLVRYDPARPSSAVLRAGLDASDGFLALFLLPFNFAGLLLAGLARSAWRARDEADDPGPGLASVEEGPVARVRLVDGTPAMRAVLAGTFISLVAALCVGFSAGMSPPAASSAAGLLLSLGAVAWVYARTRRLHESGALDLVIDRRSRRIEAPVHGEAGRRASLPLSALTGVEERTRAVAGSDGDSALHGVALRAAAGERSTELLIFETGDAFVARRLARWLEAECRAAGATLPAAPASAAPSPSP